MVAKGIERRMSDAQAAHRAAKAEKEALTVEVAAARDALEALAKALQAAIERQLDAVKALAAIQAEARTLAQTNKEGVE